MMDPREPLGVGSTKDTPFLRPPPSSSPAGVSKKADPSPFGLAELDWSQQAGGGVKGDTLGGWG